MAILKNTVVDEECILPTGNSNERPNSPVEGEIRYNTDLGIVEVYDNIVQQWRPYNKNSYTADTGITASFPADVPSDIAVKRSASNNGLYFYRDRKSNSSFQAYTLMDETFDGGGWALVFNYDPNLGSNAVGGLIHYDNNTFWKDNNIQNDTSVSPWDKQVKTAAFSNISFDEVLVVIHNKNGYSPNSSQVRGWGVYRNCNVNHKGSIRDILTQGYNVILSSGGRKTGENYAGNLPPTSRRTDQPRGGDPFIDTVVNGNDNSEDDLVFNATGYFGSSGGNSTRITTTAGLNNTNRGYTVSGLGIRHGHSGWGFYMGWASITPYCGVETYYAANNAGVLENVDPGPESGRIIYECDGPYDPGNGYVDAGISVFVR